MLARICRKRANDPKCSCTATGSYWSSTTSAAFPEAALYAEFSYGRLDADNKVIDGFVRAVRGGS
jgi:hypothetical protein